MSVLRLPIILLVFLALVGACSSGNDDDSSNETHTDAAAQDAATFAEIVSGIRQSEQEDEQLDAAYYDECIRESSKQECLVDLSEYIDSYLSSCMVMGTADPDPCFTYLDSIARQHGWSLADLERDNLLFSDPGAHLAAADCVAKAGSEFEADGRWYCAAYVSARIEALFDLCQDFWDDASCESLLSEVHARAENYQRRVIDGVE